MATVISWIVFWPVFDHVALITCYHPRNMIVNETFALINVHLNPTAYHIKYGYSTISVSMATFVTERLSQKYNA